MKYLYKYKYTLLCSIAILLLLLVNVSTPDLPSLPHIDKVVHVCVFAALSVLMLYELSHKKYSSLLVLCYVSTFGAIIELLQEYCTTSHSGNVFDWLADLTSVVLVCVVTLVVKRVKQKR